MPDSETNDLIDLAPNVYSPRLILIEFEDVDDNLIPHLKIKTDSLLMVFAALNRTFSELKIFANSLFKYLVQYTTSVYKSCKKQQNKSDWNKIMLAIGCLIIMADIKLLIIHDYWFFKKSMENETVKLTIYSDRFPLRLSKLCFNDYQYRLIKNKNQIDKMYLAINKHIISSWISSFLILHW